jgi:hypothetical protein
MKTPLSVGLFIVLKIQAYREWAFCPKRMRAE